MKEYSEDIKYYISNNVIINNNSYVCCVNFDHNYLEYMVLTTTSQSSPTHEKDLQYGTRVPGTLARVACCLHVY
jgi:hypothetical protein